MAALYLTALVVVCLAVIGVMLDAVISASRQPVWSHGFAGMERAKTSFAMPVETAKVVEAPAVVATATATVAVAPKVDRTRKISPQEVSIEHEEALA